MKHDYGYCVMGVDYAVPPVEQAQGTLSDSSNIVPNDKGLAIGRGGSVKLNATSLASRVTSFFEHRDGASTRNKLCSYTTKIAMYDSATGEFVDKITGLTTGKMLQWVNFAGKAIAVNEGADAPQYFEDSSTHGALAGSPPTGNTIAEWSNRIWFGGDSANPGRLTGSALNDPTDYSTSGALGYVQETIGDDNEPIVGIIGYFNWLLVGKKNNIYKVTGEPPTDGTSIVIEPIYSKGGDNIGFTSPWALTIIGNDLLFMDGCDIKSLKGIQEFGDVETASIIPHFRDYLNSIADKSLLQYTQFFHYKKKKQVWVSVPTSATTEFVFVLDYQFKDATGRYSFFPMSNIVAPCFGGVENGATSDVYYGDETGFVRKLDEGLVDDGAAIDSYFVTTVSGNSTKDGEITFHERRKQFNHIEAFFKPYETALTMTPSYAVDLMDDEEVRDSNNYTDLSSEDVSAWSGTGTKFKRIKLYGVAGRTLSLKWAHSTINENFTCYPSNVSFTPKSKVQIV